MRVIVDIEDASSALKKQCHREHERHPDLESVLRRLLGGSAPILPVVSSDPNPGKQKAQESGQGDTSILDCLKRGRGTCIEQCSFLKRASRQPQRRHYTRRNGEER